MEPVFRNGDALWVKQIDAHDIKVGDIVTLMPPGEESITHRVVKIEPVCNHCDSYFLTTKGDANNFTEDWEVTSDWTLALVVVHIPYAGYVFDFCTSIGGRLILLGLTATLFVIYVRRRQIAHGSNKPVSAQ